MANTSSKSPFPGVDPYVESPAFWKDFHGRIINSLSEVLLETLPDNYFALIEEDVLLLEPDLDRDKQITPDVLVGTDPLLAGSPNSALAVAEIEPVTLNNVEFVDLPTQRYIEIVRLPDRKVVTVIEVLSATNKSDGRGAYLDKRQRLLRQPVNLVEIDLLHAGRRIALTKPLPPNHYYALVSRSAERPKCSVYGWSVRQKCPKIPVPLLPSDGDALADLGKAFEWSYVRGRYDRLIRYDDNPPPPRFPAEDMEWVASIASKSARSSTTET
jgi:hypothetical protein